MDDRRRRQIEFLAEEYLRLSRLARHRRHPFECHELNDALDRLRDADEVLDFLNRTGRDPYGTLKDVDGVLASAQSGLGGVRRALDTTRFTEILDDHLDTLMHALHAEDLPVREAELLDGLGFPNLARTIGARTDLLGDEWRNGTARGATVAREFRRAPMTHTLKTAEDRIDQHRAERREFTEDREGEVTRRGADGPPERQRRWWKGLGQIVQGAAIAGADVGLAVGVLHVPIPEGGETYGVVMSVAAGAGTIMNGVGDLWGE